MSSMSSANVTNPLSSNDNSKPRAAIVTGASRGIGRAIALQLAEDGFDIALNSLPHSVDKLKELVQIIEEKGRRAIIVSGSVSDEDFVQELVDRTVAELGELYVMVANAGTLPPLLNPIINISLAEWRQVMDTNLVGTFLCYRAAARQMLKQGRGGRIIGASSTYGKQGYPLSGLYCTSKFGIRGLTQVLAAELATSHITVNAYAPGYIPTPDFVNIRIEGVDPKASLEQCIQTTPMHRLGTSEEVAGLVSYLVSDKANFVTGQSVSINGGLFYD